MSRFSKILLAAAVAGAAFLAPAVAEAQTLTTTGNMTVSANVAKSCVVTGATAVNFTAYDPVSTTQLSQQGTISVRCVRGTGYSISLSSNNGFAMVGSGGNIPYSVLQPDGSTSWTANPLAVSSGAIDTSAPRNYIATVRPAVGADVPVGSYTDTVLVTVTY